MVTPVEVLHQIFTECDRDNDGIVWLSELQQLALNHSADIKDEEQASLDEDNVPLDFDEFCLRFAGQIGESCNNDFESFNNDTYNNGTFNNNEAYDSNESHYNGESMNMLDEIDVDDVDSDISAGNVVCDNGAVVDGVEEEVLIDVHPAPVLKKSERLMDYGTSSGIGSGEGCDLDQLENTDPNSNCFIKTEQVVFKLGDDDGFEGFGEMSMEIPDNQLTVESPVQSSTPSISPNTSFNRKNSPFRLSSRRLKRGSMPPTLQPDTEDKDEDVMRQKIEDLDRKLASVEFELKTERETIIKLNTDKRDLNQKIINLEETLRDTELSYRNQEKEQTAQFQGLTDKLTASNQRHEAERNTQQSQITSYEKELAHSHQLSAQVKQQLTDEVVKLRDLWALSQEQEAMWETRYHEAVQIQSQREVELDVLTLTRVKEREAHGFDMKELQRKMGELEDQVETHEARRRSDTIVGRLQGKVQRVQEENEKLKEMTETFLSRDIKSTLAIELNSASQEEIHEAYSTMQKDYDKLQKYVDKLLMNIISEAPHLLCVDTSKK